jgi:hypothetical protein
MNVSMNFMHKILECTSFGHKVRCGSEDKLFKLGSHRDWFMIDSSFDLHVDAIFAMEFL